MNKPVRRVYKFGTFHFDPASRSLSNGEQTIRLEPKVCATLLALLQHQGRMLEKDELMKLVWPNSHVEETNLTRHISTLRTLLKDDAKQSRYIKTIPRGGYKFLVPVAESVIEEFGPQSEEQALLPNASALADALSADEASATPQVAIVRALPSWLKWSLSGVGMCLLAWLIVWVRRDNRVPIPLPSPLRDFEFEVVTLDALGNESTRRKGRAQYFVERLPEGVSLEMVALPAGEFLMGTSEAEQTQVEQEYLRYLPPQKRAEIRQWVPHEMPQHRVSVPTFYLGKYEVTQEQWRAVARLPQITRELDLNPAEFVGDKLPVTHVSWLEAQEFCERLARDTRRPYRLPSESEWEYACRAGTTTDFHFGPTISSCYANFNGKFPYGLASPGVYRGRTTAVGSYNVANAFGLSDMHGNVWEMCLDGMYWTYAEAPTDGSAWDGDGLGMFRFVTRGGAYGNDNPAGDWQQWTFYNFCAFDCRSARRNAVSRFNRYHDLGFRLALSATK